jgi:hypothetical protein
MKLICPTLNIYNNYSKKTLSLILNEIIKKDDPFFILEKTEMTYVQACWVNEGFILEYQEDSTDAHFSLEKLATKDEIIDICDKFSKNNTSWKNEYHFIKKHIKRDALTQLGFIMGYIVGVCIRGFRIVKKSIFGLKQNSRK